MYNKHYIVLILNYKALASQLLSHVKQQKSLPQVAVSRLICSKLKKHLFPITFQSNHVAKEAQNALLQSYVCSHDYHETFDSKFFFFFFFYRLLFTMRTTEP